MNALVADGVVFSNCHCTAPVCSPSRATLMTGRHPGQVGMPGNLYSPSPPLSSALPTIGKRMRALGYQTAYHGKWHLGGQVREHGFEVGEENSFDEMARLAATKFWRNRDWVEHERPFFHTVSFLDPHDHYFFDRRERVEGFERAWKNRGQPAENYPAAVQARRVDWPETLWGAYHDFYAKRIARVDREIGLLLEELRCSGFALNTWIIFASDHGDMAGEHDIPFKGPFMYDGVTRVPLVLVPPRPHFGGDFGREVPLESIEPGERDGLCSLLDIVPTILDLAGAEASRLPGRSLMPWVRGHVEHDPHESVFAEWHQPGVRMLRTADWKYVRYADGAEQLFDLANDPPESRNLVGEKSAENTRNDLRGRLDAHLETTDDQRL